MFYQYQLSPDFYRSHSWGGGILYCSFQFWRYFHMYFNILNKFKYMWNKRYLRSPFSPRHRIHYTLYMRTTCFVVILYRTVLTGWHTQDIGIEFYHLKNIFSAVDMEMQRPGDRKMQKVFPFCTSAAPTLNNLFTAS